jgi:hypothetical protein
MVMLESLLEDARAVNDRLGHSIDAFSAELAAARAWAQTVGMPSLPPPLDEASDEQSLRPGATGRGPV